MKTADRRMKPADRRTVQPREKVADATYQNLEHRQWASDIKDLAGWKCQHCGMKTKRLIADHIVEIEDGGAPLDRKNGQALCFSCHGIKTAKSRGERARGL